MLIIARIVTIRFISGRQILTQKPPYILLVIPLLGIGQIAFTVILMPG